VRSNFFSSFLFPSFLKRPGRFFASTDDASATTGASNDRSAVAVQAPVVDDGTLFALHPELASLEPLSLAGTADAPREPVCKRCVGLANYGKVLPVAMGPGEFREIMAAARVQPAVVLYTVDALDLPGSLHSLFADVFPLARDRLLVVNKVDLLLGDVQTHEQPLRKWIQGLAAAQGTHIPLHNIRLVSASTGYGVHRLLQTVWGRCSSAGAHAFVVGSANAGKSSLLNAALAFGRDKEAKATTSPWPGTTLGLIPFELHRDPVQRACVLQRPQVQDGMTQLRALLQSAAAETATATATATAAATATATATSMAPVAAGLALRAPGPQQPVLLVDTPGFQNPDHILHHLTPEELRLASHGSGRLKPQAVTLQPGQTLLCGGLARLDYVEGKGPVYLRLFLPRKVAAHVTRTDNVDELLVNFFSSVLIV
jgi:ribosome biogenesis GTPase A